jgi:hypothetical protein
MGGWKHGPHDSGDVSICESALEIQDDGGYRLSKPKPGASAALLRFFSFLWRVFSTATCYAAGHVTDWAGKSEISSIEIGFRAVGNDMAWNPEIQLDYIGYEK